MKCQIKLQLLQIKKTGLQKRRNFWISYGTSLLHDAKNYTALLLPFFPSDQFLF
jgi:hypothetical protein